MCKCMLGLYMLNTSLQTRKMFAFNLVVLFSIIFKILNNGLITIKIK